MIEIIIGVMIVIGFVKVMWDIEAVENITHLLDSKVRRLELDKLTDKMVANIPTPKKKTKKVVKKVKKNEGNK